MYGDTKYGRNVPSTLFKLSPGKLHPQLRGSNMLPWLTEMKETVLTTTTPAPLLCDRAAKREPLLKEITWRFD